MKQDLPVILEGIVTRFKGHGRQLGYPTANLTTKTDLADGIYFGFADLEEFNNHPALIFIGTPTTMGEQERRVEAHLLNVPDRDYYDNHMSLTLHYYHRPNQTFTGVDELRRMLQADETAGRQWFGAQEVAITTEKRDT